MTISSTTRKAGPLNCNGITTAFPFNFKVFKDTDVLVVTTTAGVDFTAVLTTQYTVALNSDQTANPGGTVNFLTAPLGGTTVTIGSQVPNTQGTDLAELGGFYPKVINDALDKLTIQIQQLAEKVSRTFGYSFGSGATAGGGASTPVPNSYVATDANGNIIYVSAPDFMTQAAFSNFRTDRFVGTGAQTAFTLSNNPGSVDNCDVIVNGVAKVPTTDYNVVGTTLTFVSAPGNTHVVSVRYGTGLPAIPAGNYSGYSRTVPISISYAATMTVNASLSNVFYMGTLTGNTVLAISNPNDGQTINIRFQQDATGSRTVTMPGTVTANGSINSTPNAITWLILTYVSATSSWEGEWILAPTSFGGQLMTAGNAAAARTLLGGVLGAGQAYQNLTASRSFGTTYTNSTTSAIYVFAGGPATGGGNAQIVAAVNGSDVAASIAINGMSFASVNFIVPVGATYQVRVDVGTASLTGWTELR